MKTSRWRRALALLLAAILAAACCGCGSTGDGETADAPGGTQEGDIISDAVDDTQSSKVKSFGLAYQPDSGLNPYSCTDLTNRTIFSLLYESLFTVTSAFEVEPVLCDHYTVSEDQQTYTVTLLDNIYFSNGAQLTAADVVASYEAARDSAVYGSRLMYVFSITAVDNLTVQFSLGTPYENLPLLLDIPIVQAATVADYRPVGSGPYYAADTDNGTVLQKNDAWWQEYAAAVTVDSITLVQTDSPIAVRDDFEYGATGVVCTDPNSATYVDYHCDYELWNCSTTIFDFIGFNTQSGMFSDPGLRAAFTYLIDRQTIATKIYEGFAEAAVLPCNPLSSLYDDTLAAEYSYAPQKFKEAVSSAGELGSATFLVCSSDPGRMAAAQMIVDEAAKYGLELVIDAQPTDKFTYKIYQGEYDLYYGQTRLSPNFDLSNFFNGSSLTNGGIASTEMLDLCKAALENSGNYYSLHEQVMEQGLICPVLFKAYAVYATRGIISNMVPAVDNVFHTSNGRALSDALPTLQQEQSTETSEEQPIQETPET